MCVYRWIHTDVICISFDRWCHTHCRAIASTNLLILHLFLLLGRNLSKWQGNNFLLWRKWFHRKRPISIAVHFWQKQPFHSAVRIPMSSLTERHWPSLKLHTVWDTNGTLVSQKEISNQSWTVPFAVHPASRSQEPARHKRPNVRFLRLRFTFMNFLDGKRLQQDSSSSHTWLEVYMQHGYLAYLYDVDFLPIQEDGYSDKVAVLLYHICNKEQEDIATNAVSVQFVSRNDALGHCLPISCRLKDKKMKAQNNRTKLFILQFRCNQISTFSQKRERCFAVLRLKTPLPPSSRTGRYLRQ